MTKPIDVSLVLDGVRYDATVWHESDGGRNVLVTARCVTCCRARTWPEDSRVERWSSSRRRIVGWRVSRAWPRAVRDGLTAAIRCALSEGT